MKLASQTPIAACEQRLRELVDVPADEALQLPNSIRHLAAGGEVSVAQFIVTWAQKTSAMLRTYIEGTTATQIEDLTRRLYGLVGALCAGSVIDVRGNDITEAVQDAALERLSALQGIRPKQAFRGPSTEVVCADHLGMGAPYLLYERLASGGQALRSRRDFSSLGAWLIRATFPLEYIQAVDSGLPEALGGLLFELLSNTEDHGMVGADGDLLRKSIRLIKTNHWGVTPASLAAMASDFHPLARYAESLTPPTGASQIHLFELSVLDSGPGFACSWTRRPLEDMTLAEEEHAVRQCFGSGTSKNHNRFGQGLLHVTRVLRAEGGFLRLRTGRLSMYVDYSAQGAVAGASDALRRWLPDGNEPLAPVAGSLLTVMLPMKRRS